MKPVSKYIFQFSPFMQFSAKKIFYKEFENVIFYLFIYLCLLLLLLLLFFFLLLLLFLQIFKQYHMSKSVVVLNVSLAISKAK